MPLNNGGYSMFKSVQESLQSWTLEYVQAAAPENYWLDRLESGSSPL